MYRRRNSDLNEIKSLKETILSLKRDSAIRDQEEYDLTNISEGLINTNTEAELCAILDSKLPALREINAAPSAGINRPIPVPASALFEVYPGRRCVPVQQ